MTSSRLSDLNQIKRPRLEWVNFGRGIAELVVVLVHFFNSAEENNVIRLDPIISQVNAFRELSPAMPLFFLVSGILLARAANAQKPREFVNNQFRSLMYPYFVWSLITFLATVIASNLGNLVNAQFGPGDLIRILYNPLLQLWYLYALFLVVVTYKLIYQTNTNPMYFLYFSLGLFILGAFIDFWQFTESELPTNICRYTIFFAIGIVYSDQLRTTVTGASRRILVPVAVVGILSWWLPILFGLLPQDRQLIMLIKTMGMMGLVSCAVLLSRLNLSRYNPISEIKRWGGLSLQIYLVHWLMLVGFRIVVVQFLGIDHPIVYVVGSLVTAIYGPILLNMLFERIGFKYAFRLPKVAESKTQTVPEAQTA